MTDRSTASERKQASGDLTLMVASAVAVLRSFVHTGRPAAAGRSRPTGRLEARKWREAEIVKGVGSGLDFKTKGLCSLLERAMRGEKLKVAVARRDRLARFGFDVAGFVIGQSGRRDRGSQRGFFQLRG